MEEIADAAWEALCNCCGGCCFEKSIDAYGQIFSTREPCRYLDIHSRRCRIYPKRFDIEKDCILLTLETVRRLSWLPSDCGYRALTEN